MPNKKHILFRFLAYALPALVLFSNLETIPFHPDEATLIYTSQDFETLISSPLDLAWTPDQNIDTLTRYRLVDEPLSKIIFGLARNISGHPAASVNSDWNWSLNWQENVSIGALPTPSLLMAVRAISTIFVLLSGILFFETIQKTLGYKPATLFLVLFGTNALILLHGRRAMAEGLMLFSIALVFWSILISRKNPWIVGAATGLALGARYLLLPFLIFSWIIVIWDELKGKELKKAALISMRYGASVGLVLLFLHPVLWKHPFKALDQMYRLRTGFMQEGNQLIAERAPDLIVDEPVEKVGVLVFHNFLSPLAYYDVGNYALELQPSIEEYANMPLFHLWHGPIWGGLLLSLSAFGFILAAYRAFYLKNIPQFTIAIPLFAFLLQAGLTFIAFSLPIQRYYLPVLPYFLYMAILPFFQPPDQGNNQPIRLANSSS